MEETEFLSMLASRKKLNEGQVEHLAKLKKVVETFHKDARTYDEVQDLLTRAVTEESIVLESGHQPNFLPYAGVWRKVFLLDFFAKKLDVLNYSRESIPLFGFADYNLCTAKWLYQNRIPAKTRDGFETIGFTISGKDRWNRFDSIEKPTEDKWTKELERIKGFYHNVVRDDGEAAEYLERILEEMWRSYERGKSFSDVNALLFSQICNLILGLKVLFFRYSDVQREGIFIDEWRRILAERETFNRRYNEIVKSNNLEDIGYCSEDSVPFWYHCRCGGKVPLFSSPTKPNANEVYAGGCPVCNSKYEVAFEELEDNFACMSPNAVTRNLVFSEGLGTALFVSGAGGGLRYGVISDGLSSDFEFTVPITLSWRGKDYYLGPVHNSLLKDLQRTLDLDETDFYDDEQSLSQKVQEKKKELATEINRLEKEEGGKTHKKRLNKYRGRYKNMDTQLQIASHGFSVVPSALDLFISVGLEAVLNCWEHALVNLDITEGDFYTINRDVTHGDKAISQIYRNIRVLGDQIHE